MDRRSQQSPAKNLDTCVEEEEGYEEEEGEQEEYEDDGFVGESENDPVEDEEVVTDDNDFGEEDCMLDVEIEDLSGKTTGLKGKKEVAPPAAQSEFYNIFGRKLSIWDATKFLSKWKLAHMRGYHIGIYGQNEAHKNLIKERELILKANVPLPIMCTMEEEVLRILEKMEKRYRSDFGAQHPLTKDVQTRIIVIRAQLDSMRQYVRPTVSGWRLFLQNWFPWLETLLNKETSNAPEEKSGRNEKMEDIFEEKEKEEEKKEKKVKEEEEENAEEEEEETEFPESSSEGNTLNRSAHDKRTKEKNEAPQPGWGQWLGSLLRRTPASSEAQNPPPRAGWGQWFGNLLRRTPAPSEGKEGEKSRLVPVESGEDIEVPLEPTWSFQLMNVWSRSQLSQVTEADDRNGSHTDETQKEEGQRPQAGWGQQLGALLGRSPGQDNDSKVSPASSQKHV